MKHSENRHLHFNAQSNLYDIIKLYYLILFYVIILHYIILYYITAERLQDNAHPWGALCLAAAGCRNPRNVAALCGRRAEDVWTDNAQRGLNGAARVRNIV